MCTDIEFLPQIMVVTETEFMPLATAAYDHRNSSASVASSSSSTTTTTTTATANNPTSWIERKLFTHFKRLFQRNALSSHTNSFDSSRRSSYATEEVNPISHDVQPKTIQEEHNKETNEASCFSAPVLTPMATAELPASTAILPSAPTLAPSSISSTSPKQTQSIGNDSKSVDLLYDYDRLLARCLERQKHDLDELKSSCATPITIPHAELVAGHSRSKLVNWKSYIRLFQALNRDPRLFQQYINQHYDCQSSINQREQLTFNVRTTRSTLDKMLQRFLNEYVTCLACQKAKTHLIKSTGLWRIECQLCGSQRSVKRLKWKQ